MIVEKLSVLLDFHGEKAARDMTTVGKTAKRELGATEASADRARSRLSMMNAVAAAGGAVFAGYAFAATKAAADLEQAVGGTTAIFGAQKARLDEFAESAADNVGLSEQLARQLTSQLGGALKGYGYSVDQAADKSMELTRLGADLAATFGGSTKDAVEALSSALRGEFDPLERYGITLNQTLIDQKAVAMGLAESTSHVSQYSRAQAALALIMERSTDAQGQFAREANTASGQAERSAAKMADAQADFGRSFLPIYAKVSEVVGSTASAFSALPGPVQTGAIAITGLALAAGPAMTVVKGVGGALSGLGGLFDRAAVGAYNLSGDLGGLARRGGLVVGAVGTIAAGLYLLERRLSDNAEAADQWIQALTGSGTIPEQIAATKREIEGLERSLAAQTTIDVDALDLHFAWDATDLDRLDAAKKRLAELESAVQGNANSTELAERGVDEFGNALDDTSRATGELARKQDELWRQLTGQFDASQAAQDSWARVNESLGAFNQAMAAGKASTAEGSAAQRDLAQAVEAHARARADEYVAQVTANGGTVDAATKTGIYRQTLVDLANQYPAVRGQLQPTIDLANRTVVTQFLAQFSWSGDPFVKSLVEGLAGGKWNNDLVLQGAARAAVSAAGIDPNTIPKFDTGGVVPGRRGAPQLVMAHGGETILPTHRAGASGGGTYNVTVNGVVGAPRDVAMAISEELRRLERERRF